jgi:hypothetical protein
LFQSFLRILERVYIKLLLAESVEQETAELRETARAMAEADSTVPKIVSGGD